MEKDDFIMKVILWIGPIVFAFLFWFYKKEDLIKCFLKYNPFKRIQSQAIIDLEKNYLTIENKEFLNDAKVSKKFKYVLWPVVPTDSPNLIHVLSLFYLSKLSEYGLRIIVFVFDSYYEMIKNKARKVVKEEVEKFIDDLKKMGLRKCWFKIEKESDYLFNKQNVDVNFENRFYLFMGSLKYGQLIKLKKPHITDESPSIRFFKPILNMLYLKMVPYKIGFTFSGYDEKQVWDTFSENVIDGQTMRLTNFYLPILPKLSGGQTDVLDKVDNITIDDSVNNIYSKIVGNNHCLEADGLIRMILEIFLNNEEKIKIKINNTDYREYSRFDELETDLGNNELKDKVLKSISQKIYECFHQQ